MAKRNSEDKNHYVDNKKFLEELIEYKKAYQKFKKEGKKGDRPPQASNYIGQCIMDIANNLAKKPNFANYIFKEEMVSDAIENCIMYLGNFDPKVSKNPFAFFTTVIYWCFIRRINKEKKQLFIKMKCIEKNDRSGKFHNQILEEHRYNEDERMRSENPYAHFLSLSDNDLKNFAKSFEEKQVETRKKAKKKRVAKKKSSRKTLEDIME